MTALIALYVFGLAPCGGCQALAPSGSWPGSRSNPSDPSPSAAGASARQDGVRGESGPDGPADPVVPQSTGFLGLPPLKELLDDSVDEPGGEESLEFPSDPGGTN